MKNPGYPGFHSKIYFHLLIQQLKSYAISALMEAVCGEYARTVNAWRGRTGHLYEKPYGVKWVWRDSDIPILANYIHENPTAAHLVSSPEEWEFSSCREYLGLRENVFINMQPVLSQLDTEEDYRTFLALRGKEVANLSKRCLFRE